MKKLLAQLKELGGKLLLLAAKLIKHTEVKEFVVWAESFVNALAQTTLEAGVIDYNIANGYLKSALPLTATLIRFKKWCVYITLSTEPPPRPYLKIAEIVERTKWFTFFAQVYLFVCEKVDVK